MLFKNTKNFVFTLISLLSMVANADVMWPTHNSPIEQRTSYSPVATAVCNALQSYESVGDCLLANKGSYFDPKVQDFCISNVVAYQRKDCLFATKNKSFQQVELDACAREYSHNRNDCLKKMGQMYNPMRPSETASSDPALDALDSLLRDLLRESYQTSQQVDYCRVENSNGTF